MQFKVATCSYGNSLASYIVADIISLPADNYTDLASSYLAVCGGVATCVCVIILILYHSDRDEDHDHMTSCCCACVACMGHS